jgi:hypothetical protein
MSASVEYTILSAEAEELPSHFSPLSLEPWTGPVVLSRLDNAFDNWSVAHLSPDYVPGTPGRPQIGSRIEVAESILDSRPDRDTQVIALFDPEGDPTLHSNSQAVEREVYIEGRRFSATGVRVSKNSWSVTIVLNERVVSVVADGVSTEVGEITLGRGRTFKELNNARSDEFERWKRALAV